MINITMLTVQDVEATAQWYARVLGFESAHGGDEYDLLTYEGRPVLQLHNMEPDINHAALRTPGTAPGDGVLVWLQVEDVQGMMKRLERLAVTLDTPPYLNPYSGAWEVWFRDPDGYRIVLAGIPNKQAAAGMWEERADK